MDIVVSGIGWAKNHKRDFDGVITIQDPDKRNGLRFHKNPHPDHLILHFIDIDTPMPHPYCDQPIFTIATPDQVWRAIEFGRKFIGGKLLIHCQAGISRSTAIALCIIADRLGVGKEQEALDELLTIQPEAVPNLHVVELADGLMYRSGALLAIVKAWDDQLPANLKRRREQRQAQFIHYRVPRITEPELFEGTYYNLPRNVV